MSNRFPRALLSGGLFLVLLFLASKPSGAQDTAYEVRSDLYTTTGEALPFWFHSNADGTVDPSGTNWLNHVSLEHSVWENDHIALEAGGNAALRWSDSSSLHFSELYVRANGYGFQLDAGRFRQPIGLNNHDLSIGSMMVSRNAVPPPRISITTPEFNDVPFADGYLQYKGMFSHGWMESDRHVRSPYLHQKYLYLRLNIGPLSGTGGIVHNAQWGGEDPDFGRLPQSFGDYLRLITARGADEDSNVPSGEINNVIGNSVSAYEFGLNYEHENFNLNLTRLFYLEDKVSTRFRSPWDGVWGVNLKMKEKGGLLDAITYEHINTMNQDAKSWELIGRRDYYDNFVYESGWTYEKRTLGIPLILFDGTTITNNVIVGHHIGFTGMLSDRLTYRTLATFSRNYGVRNDWVERGGDSIPDDRDDITPRDEFRRDQSSLMLELNYQVPGNEHLQIHSKVSTDLGELYENNLGLMLGIRWMNAF